MATLLFGWQAEHDDVVRATVGALPPEADVVVDEELRCLVVRTDGLAPPVEAATYRVIAGAGVFNASPGSEEAVRRHVPAAERAVRAPWALYEDEATGTWRATCESCSWPLSAPDRASLEAAAAGHDARVHTPEP